MKSVQEVDNLLSFSFWYHWKVYTERWSRKIRWQQVLHIF